MLVAKLSILKMHHKNLIKVVKDHFLHSVSDRLAPSTQEPLLESLFYRNLEMERNTDFQ
jgi:hypothetical protein